MKKIAVLVVVLVFAICLPAFANSIGDNAASKDYVTKAPAMLLRGIGNVLISPGEVIYHTYQQTMEGRPFVGTLEGLINGIFWGLDRGGRGGWDVLTFWAPNYNGAPPEHTFELTSGMGGGSTGSSSAPMAAAK